MGGGTAARKLQDGRDGLWRNGGGEAATERRDHVGRQPVPQRQSGGTPSLAGSPEAHL